MPLGLLIMLLVCYLALVAGIFAFQRQLMYHPDRLIGPPAEYGLGQVRDILTPGGVQLWVSEAKHGYPTIIYFHGNASHLGNRADKFRAFLEEGFGLVALGYPGFGKSAGSPSETANYAAARLAVAYAHETLGVPYARLIYFGESLGSGVGVQMAVEHPPGLLALEAAYESVETRSAELYPFILGVRMLVLDKYDSLSKITRIHCPLLMLHGARDGTIPIRHGRAVFAAAALPKRFVEYPDVDHADFSPEQVVTPLVQESRRYGLIDQDAMR